MLHLICEFNVILVSVWAILDSLWRWTRFRDIRVTEPCTHKYWGLHYYVGLLALILWYFHVGEIVLPTVWYNFTTLTGTLLCWLGWLLTWWGRCALFSFWSASVYPVIDSLRVQRGPYFWLRHPIYFGESIFFLGISLFLSNVLAFLLIFVCLSLYNVYRSRCEKLTAKNFGYAIERTNDIMEENRAATQSQRHENPRGCIL